MIIWKDGGRPGGAGRWLPDLAEGCSQAAGAENGNKTRRRLLGSVNNPVCVMLFFDRFAKIACGPPGACLADVRPEWDCHASGEASSRCSGQTSSQVLRWVAASKATLVLCGHIHQKSGIQKVNLGNRRVILRAGTAGDVHDDEDGDKRRIYHLLDLAPDGGIRIRAREFRDSRL